jgi:hypothetical protein
MRPTVVQPFACDNDLAAGLPHDATAGSREDCLNDNSACVMAVTPGARRPSTTRLSEAAMLVLSRPPPRRSEPVMPPFHLSAVPSAPPRRPAARETLLQDLQGARQPTAQRGPAWWRALGPRPGTIGGGWLPR